MLVRTSTVVHAVSPESHTVLMAPRKCRMSLFLTVLGCMPNIRINQKQISLLLIYSTKLYADFAGAGLQAEIHDYIT